MKELCRPSIIAGLAALLFLFPAGAETNQPRELYVEQCKVFPDVLLYRDQPEGQTWTPHLTLTNVSTRHNDYADVTVAFYDSRDVEFPAVEWLFGFGPREKRKIDLSRVWLDHSHVFNERGKFDPANPEGWFSDGFIVVRSQVGGDVRAVLELVRGENVPVREYGQSCASR